MFCMAGLVFAWRNYYIKNFYCWLLEISENVLPLSLGVIVWFRPTNAATNHWDAPMPPPKEKGHQKGEKKNHDHKINPQKSPNLKKKHRLLSIQTFHLGGKVRWIQTVSRPSWIFWKGEPLESWDPHRTRPTPHPKAVSESQKLRALGEKMKFYTLPKTNMEPKKYRFGRWCSFSKQWCSGSMLVFFGE